MFASQCNVMFFSTSTRSIQKYHQISYFPCPATEEGLLNLKSDLCKILALIEVEEVADLIIKSRSTVYQNMLKQLSTRSHTKSNSKSKCLTTDFMLKHNLPQNESK